MLEVKNNRIIIDWLSFSINTTILTKVKELLRIEKFETLTTSGFNGYKDREYMNGISIHYNHRSNNNIWIEFSGKGCRWYEQYVCCMYDLIEILKVTDYKINYSRIDIAYDIFNDILNMNRIYKDINESKYISDFRSWETVNSNKGKSVYLGSELSDIRLRIYDKQLESKTDYKWIRIEFQLRDKACDVYIDKLSRLDYLKQNGLTIELLYKGMLKQYIRFLENLKDENKCRNKTAKYWEKFIDTEDKIKLYYNTGIDKEFDRIFMNTIKQSGNSINTIILSGQIEALM